MGLMVSMLVFGRMTSHKVCQLIIINRSSDYHVTIVIFHVATLLPTLPSNTNCSNKKLHIGNDFVTLIYNDSKNSLEFGLIKVIL